LQLGFTDIAKSAEHWRISLFQRYQPPHPYWVSSSYLRLYAIDKIVCRVLGVVEFPPLDAGTEAKMPPEMLQKGIPDAPARGIPDRNK
jgi:hypothetical protein